MGLINVKKHLTLTLEGTNLRLLLTFLCGMALLLTIYMNTQNESTVSRSFGALISSQVDFSSSTRRIPITRFVRRTPSPRSLPTTSSLSSARKTTHSSHRTSSRDKTTKITKKTPSPHLLPTTSSLSSGRKTTPLSHRTSSRNTTTKITTKTRLTAHLPQKCNDFVIFSDALKDGRGLGNQIFTMVAGLMLAQLTKRRLVMDTKIISKIDLESIFTYRYERVNISCDKYGFSDRWNLAYNPEIESFINFNSSESRELRQKVANKSIVLGGFFQSWKYTLNDNIIRNEYLKINDEYTNYTNHFFDSVCPTKWVPHTYTRIGVHVRRGDVLTAHNIRFGYASPNASYFIKAMNKTCDLFKKVQFIVVSNDLKWCHENLNASNLEPLLNADVDIVFSDNSDRFKDFAILAFCHHTIMSTGTYGWWAAFLNKGTTIYYKDWPLEGSDLAKKFKKEDFFPPSWIGLSD